MKPIPYALVRERMHYLGVGFVVAGAVLILTTVRPAVATVTWWLVLLMLIKSILILRVNWEKARIATILPFSMASLLFTTAALWFNPGHPEVSALFLLIAVFIGLLYDWPLLLPHLGFMAVAFGIHIWQIGMNGVSLSIGFCTIAITAFLRIQHAALNKQDAQIRNLELLLDLLPVLKARGVQEVIEAAIRQLVKATKSDSGIVAVLNHERGTLKPYYLYFKTPVPPEEEYAWRSYEFPVGVGLSGWVAQHHQTLITGDAIRDPRGTYVPGSMVTDESIMVAPLLAQGTLYGVLRLNRYGLNQYRKEDLELLELMAPHVSDAVARAALEERMARTDPLTGVYNRHYLNEWSERLKPSGQQISVIMADCRGFKQINDRWGHLTGDRILQEAARLLKESVRDDDLVFRYGGDEFMVVLSHAGAEEASTVATRLRDRVNQWNQMQPPDGPLLTLDIGTDTADEAQWVQLLERADARMYASKRAS